MAHRFTFRYRSPQLLAILAGAAVLGACGDGSGPGEISAEASAYLQEVMAPMEAFALNRHSIDWSAFRAEVLSVAAGAQTVVDTYGAIQRALHLLGDGHSTFRTREGILLFVSADPCASVPVSPPPVQPDIGYVRIRSFGGGDSDADVYIQDIQREMAERDTDDVIGWIVDLRGNVGGNFWPMLAAVGPVLGEGVAGFYEDADGVRTPWEYRDGTAWLGTQEMHRGPAPYQPSTAASRVAVLTDNRTIAAGEAVAVAFRGRPETRSFGQETCGLSLGSRSFVMSDGGTLDLMAYVMVDRTGEAYGDRLWPDVPGFGINEPVEQAMAWIRSGE